MANKSGNWNFEKLDKLDRPSDEWEEFVSWQKTRILERLQRYNNTDTAKVQLAETGNLTPYQHYKINNVSKFLLKALTQIESGNYGICSNCQKTIPAKRLFLVPGALRCMDCENAK
jgi:RNA polymerase-binding transcription factor DksA